MLAAGCCACTDDEPVVTPWKNPDCVGLAPPALTCSGLQPTGFVRLPQSYSAMLTSTASGDVDVWLPDRLIQIPAGAGEMRTADLPYQPPTCMSAGRMFTVAAFGGQVCRRVECADFVELRSESGALLWTRQTPVEWQQAFAAPDGKGHCALVLNFPSRLLILDGHSQREVHLPSSFADPARSPPYKAGWGIAAADPHGGWWLAGALVKQNESDQTLIGHVDEGGKILMLPGQLTATTGFMQERLEATAEGAWHFAVAADSDGTRGSAEFYRVGAQGIAAGAQSRRWQDHHPDSHPWSYGNYLAASQPTGSSMHLIFRRHWNWFGDLHGGVYVDLLSERISDESASSWLWPPSTVRNYRAWEATDIANSAVCGWPHKGMFVPDIKDMDAVELPGGGLALLMRWPGTSMTILRFAPTAPCAGYCGDGNCRSDEKDWCWADCHAE